MKKQSVMKDGCKEKDAVNDITNYVKQSLSWEADSNSIGQETPSLLCNLKVHYCLHRHL